MLHIHTLLAFVKFTRPVFLLGGVLLYGLGVAISAAHGSTINLGQAALGQLMVSAIQLMSQCANEVFDVEADRQNARGRTLFSGGSGVLPGGGITQQTALAAARGCAIVAMALVAIVGWSNPLAGAIAALALLGGWFYSAPPLSLMSSGWGEISASLIVTFLVPMTGYVMQANRLDPFVLLVCLPLYFLHWAMLIAFELPDMEADQSIGKRTQTVRLGVRKMAFLHAFLLAGGMAGIALLAKAAAPYATALPWAIPLIIWQALLYSASTRATAGARRLSLLTLGAVALFSLASALALTGVVFVLMQGL